MSLRSQIDMTKIPNHVALIMDGNGRWAKKQQQERIYGHAYGIEAMRSTMQTAKKIGIKYLTFFAFSTENWNRPEDEVNGIMELLVQFLQTETANLVEEGVRFNVIGDESRLPLHCQERIELSKQETAHNTAFELILALNYSGRADLTYAMKNIAAKVLRQEIALESIDEETITAHLYTNTFPDPDLLVRTSGELRISNFLNWQLAYTEMYFTDVYWPDFLEEELYKAILSYQSRERRFGLVSEQL